MRQKYILSKNTETKEMAIQEYAVVDNDSYRKDKYLLTDADFVLLSEQKYPLEEIKEKIAGDREDIIAGLRKGEFFPARTCAEKIADSIVALFDSDGDDPIVLVYDDKDGFTQETPEEEDTDTAEKENTKAEPAK
jgi:hypothetical protein